MARFNQPEIATTHGGVTRFTNAFRFIASLNITRAFVAALAAVSARVQRAAARVRALALASSAARKERAEDEKLWNVALGDARVMADLSRALSKDGRTYRGLRAYY